MINARINADMYVDSALAGILKALAKIQLASAQTASRKAVENNSANGS